MRISVDKDYVKILDKPILHKGEYNINNCTFEFSEEYDNLVKVAVFSAGNLAYKIDIVENECDVPHEVLGRVGDVMLGVYGYSANENELVLRYSPITDYFRVGGGSYVEGGYTPEQMTPSQYELYSQACNEAIADVRAVGDQLLEDKENGVFDGPQGEIGPEGPEGPIGPKGETAITVNVGNVETVDFDGVADVINTGDDKDLVLDFYIPRGKDGYTPVKGKDYFDGEPGKDYVITDTDYQNIANVVEKDIKPTLDNNLKSAKDYTDNAIIRDFKDISYNQNTATFVFTRHDNTTITVDLPIEQTVKNGYYDDKNKELVLVLVSNQEIRIPASGLIDDYNGLSSATIQCIVSSDNKITCNIISGTISKTLLTTELQQEITNKVNTDTFTTELNKKVDTETFTTELNKKLDIDDVTESQYTITYEDGTTKTIKAVVWK